VNTFAIWTAIIVLAAVAALMLWVLGVIVRDLNQIAVELDSLRRGVEGLEWEDLARAKGHGTEVGR
jgi:hypothetical protein